MKLKYWIDYKGLEEYLKSLKEDQIERNWAKPQNPKLFEGHSVFDIEYFGTSRKTEKEKIIQHGEPFLVDALGNDLSICILSRKRYKLPNNRIVTSKFVTTIIDDCRSLYGTPLSGYWKIPNQFIKPLIKAKFHHNRKYDDWFVIINKNKPINGYFYEKSFECYITEDHITLDNVEPRIGDVVCESHGLHLKIIR